MNFSVESADSLLEPEISTNKKRRENVFETKHIFTSKEEATDLLKSQGFSYIYSSITSEGRKWYYRCNKIKRASKIQCAAMRMIWFSNTDFSYHVLYSEADHNHDELVDSIKGNKYSDEMIEFVKECIEKQFKPKKIIREIHKAKDSGEKFKDAKVPDSKQLQYLISSRNLRDKPEDIIRIGELIEWCNLRMQVPDDMDQAFVLDCTASNVLDNLYFRFVMSTKRLLQNGLFGDIFGTDATYKLNWNGFPLLILGRIDKGKHFHVIGIACCSHEKEDDFRFFFQR